MNQTIKGDNNFQAGGDVFVGTPPTFSPDNPNAVQCPHCWNITGRQSQQCPCGFRVKAHFDAIERLAKRDQFIKVSSISAVIGLVLFYASQYIDFFSMEIRFVSFGAIGVAILYFQAATACDN